MSAIQHAWSHPLSEVVGWSLVHFVWQGAAIAIIVGVVLRVMRRSSANARYVAAGFALATMAACPVVTAGWLARHVDWSAANSPPMPVVTAEFPDAAPNGDGLEYAPPIERSPREWLGSSRVTNVADRIADDAATPLQGVPPGLTLRERVGSTVERYLPWIVGLWLIGVGLLSGRLLVGWIQVQRLRRSAIRPVADACQELLRRLASRLRVSRPVRLVESALVQVPTVVGCLRPMILLPASAITGLTTDQLQAVLAHELAHIRRHDYLVNLLQTVVETLLFYHPAVWWVSRQIRSEREHCCDDIAVATCGDRVGYARMLLALEELRAPASRLAVAADGGSLRSRIARLLSLPVPSENRSSALAASLIALTAVVSLATSIYVSLRADDANLNASESSVVRGAHDATGGLLKQTETESDDRDESGNLRSEPRRGQETRAEPDSSAEQQRGADEVAGRQPLEPKDQLATQLARRAHAQAAALDKLPRFSYRVKHRHGVVDSMRAIEPPSLDQLKTGLTAPVLDGDWFGWFYAGFSWDEKRFLYDSRHQFAGSPRQLLKHTFWTATDGWERGEAIDNPSLNFWRLTGPDQFWNHMHLFEYGYLRLTPRRFWWGGMVHLDQSMSLVPPDKATWKHLGVERFGDEDCVVVESALRAERLWIGRDSGHIRCVLSYWFYDVNVGRKQESDVAIERIAGRKFTKGFDSANWLLNDATDDQWRELSVLASERSAADFPKKFRMNELVQFDDYREVSPGVWLPFRESRTHAPPAESAKTPRDAAFGIQRPRLENGKVMHEVRRSELVVEEVRTDRDLAARYAELLPKEGDQVQDQRFLAPVNFKFKVDRTDDEIRSMAEKEYRKQFERKEEFNRMVQTCEDLIGKPAPRFPTGEWVGGRRPDLAGKPYLLHFWETSCWPCRKDLPLLKTLWERGATIVGMHPSGTPADAVESFIRQQKLAYPTFLATNLKGEPDIPKVDGYPTGVLPYYILVDAKGRVAGHGFLSELLQESGADALTPPRKGRKPEEDSSKPNTHSAASQKTAPAAPTEEAPQNATAQALFKTWQASARSDGKIPGGAVGQLGAKVEEFVTNNRNDAAGVPYAKKVEPILPRFDGSHDWTPADALKLLNDLAALSEIPLWTTIELLGQLQLQSGQPLPAELRDAPWGEPTAEGLRAARPLDPQAKSYPVGTALRSRILLHNAGNGPVLLRGKSFMQPAYAAADATGKEIDVTSTYWTTLGRVQTWRLAPGEFIEIITPGFGVGKDAGRDEWADVRVGSWIDVAAGVDVRLSPLGVGAFVDDSRATRPKTGAELKREVIRLRLNRELPLPASAADRELIVRRVTKDIFGNDPTGDEISAFVNDKSDDPFAALTDRLLRRGGLVGFVGEVKPGSITFRTTPADPDAANRPKVAIGPGRYTLDKHARLIIVGKPVDGRRTSDVEIRFWSEKATDEAPGPPHKIAVPDGFGTWAITCRPGSGILWVVTKDAVRKIDYRQPAQVKETPVTRGGADDMPDEFRDAIRRVLTISNVPPEQINDLLADRADDHATRDAKAQLNAAIARSVGYLKRQQQTDGSWSETGPMRGGVTALALHALLQADVRVDDPVVQRGLKLLRSIDAQHTYVVALQTLVFCAASPMIDADVIRRNVEWLERAQLSNGQAKGGWGYQQEHKGADGSNTRFAVLALHAAANSGFVVRDDTWLRISAYWLDGQRADGAWGYQVVPVSQASASMTCAGIASLSIAERHRPRGTGESDSHRKAIQNALNWLAADFAAAWPSHWLYYYCHCLSKVGSLENLKKLGDRDWQAAVVLRLLKEQGNDGSFATADSAGFGPNTVKAVATSFALLALTGQAEPASGAVKNAPR